MKTIYLANPYGFSAQQKSKLLPEIKAELEHLGLEVWEPFERNNQIDFTKPGWARTVGAADVSDVRNADAIFAVVNGTPPDEGVMVELGIAIALGKPTFLFRDDFRRCTDSEDYPLNLMLFTGMPPHWRLYWHDNVLDISNPDKALAKWATEGRSFDANGKFIEEHGPIGPDCFGGTDYPDSCLDCGAPAPCNVDHS